MNNAFNILGAEPTDSAEHLQELLDEKELLLDDASEVQAAYADLTNPKKRVQHELLYFCNDALEDFTKLVNRSFEETPSIGKIAHIVVELGWWFESDDDELFERINNAREESGFTQIEDVDTVSQAVQSLKQDCIQSVNTYFDRLKEKSLVGIFNQIVKIEDYESFFIDELVAHYELTVQEALQAGEDKCKSIFSEIEKICWQFNNGSTLSSTLKDKVDAFAKALKKWDAIAQPLQVNMQCRGGQHEGSSELVHDLRNRIIELCNKSQESLAVVVPVASYNSNNEDKEIKLNSSNFETYFSVSSSGPSSGRSVTVNYSIAPKKSSYSATSLITVKVKITVRSSKTSTLRKSETVSVTLNKSSGYKKSGSITISLSSSTNYTSLYYDTEITSCSGTLLT